MVGRYASYLLLLVPMAIGVLLLVGVHRRRRPAGAAPACGKCGYDVRGLPTTVCPECGSELRVVGVLRPGGIEPPSKAWRLAGWSAFVLLTIFVPLALLWGEVQRHWLMVHEVARDKVLLAPVSLAYRQIRIDYHARAYGDNSFPLKAPIPRQLTLTLSLNDGTTRTMEVTATGAPAEPRTPVAPGSPLGYEYRDSAGRTIQSRDGLKEDALAGWMAGAGIRSADPEVRREIAEALRSLRGAFERPAQFGNVSVSGNGPFGGGSSGGRSNLHPAHWSQFVPPAVALLVWVVGLRFMLRRPQRPDGPQT